MVIYNPQFSFRVTQVLYFLDKSPLLLCVPERTSRAALTEGYIEMPLMGSAPLIVNPSDLQIYKGQIFESKNGVVAVNRCLWKMPKGKKIEVALKLLKIKDSDKFNTTVSVHRLDKIFKLR